MFRWVTATTRTLLRRGDETTIVEMKRYGRTNNEPLVEAATAQLARYLSLAKARSGIIYLWSPMVRADLEERRAGLDEQKEIWIVGTVAQTVK